MESALRFHPLDWLVIAGYLTALTAVGIYHSRRQHDLKDYFLAGRSMGWIPIGLSLMAALNSGMDYLMQPSAMIKFGAACLVVNFTWFFLYPYVFFVTLPLFRRLGGFSAYEYLERRFGLAVRSLAAGIFMLWRLGWMAAALYTPSLAIAVASGHRDQIVPIVIVLGAIVTFYTMAGGIRAVIWNDVAQFCVMFGGLAATLIIILLTVDGGFSAIVANVTELGPDAPTSPGKGGLLAYFFLPMPALGYLLSTLVTRVATYTSDQVMVQRFQTSKSIREARRGFLITAIGDAAWMLALCFVGLALFTYFETQAPPPPEIRANEDQLFPYYMGQVFPAGLTGLVIAAIFAASLSSIDSAINSLSTVAAVDFYHRLIRRRADAALGGAVSDAVRRRQLWVSRAITLAVGLIGITLACNVSKLGTIFEIANKLVNGFTGPLLGIFLLGMFTKRANTRGVFLGGLVGTCVSLYAILWSSPALLNDSFAFLLGLFPAAVANGGAVLSFIWPSVFGLVVTLVGGYLFSLASPRVTDAAREWNWFAVTARPLLRDADAPASVVPEAADEPPLEGREAT